MFASPQAPDGSRDEQVVEAPLPFPALFERAQTAAAEGLVKQTFVIDDRRRVEVDARHGHLKQRTLDAATVDKIMGGKDRALRPDASAALLRGIGIMNADGTISARNAKKYKQVNHMVELCRPVWERVLAQRDTGDAGDVGGVDEPVRIVDLACGNSYLSFVLLEGLRLAGVPARLLGIDLRPDVVATSRARAEAIGFGDRAQFEASRLAELDGDRLSTALGGPPDIAVSLHACDTATDEALALAITARVPAILCVPCCQAELARQLQTASFPALVDHGLLRRGYGELLTDALRVEVLTAHGYEVGVLEFVASTHTPKNTLLRAVRRPGPRAPAPVDLEPIDLEPIAARCRALGVEPSLLRLLRATMAGEGSAL